VIYGLTECSALARVSYHAQELSLLTAQYGVGSAEIIRVKADLDAAYNDLLNRPLENKDVN